MEKGLCDLLDQEKIGYSTQDFDSIRTICLKEHDVAVMIKEEESFEIVDCTNNQFSMNSFKSSKDTIEAIKESTKAK